MPSFAELIQQSPGVARLFIPSAVLPGALHGLKPGHSKTMMVAFIVAIRGTLTLALLLGLATTLVDVGAAATLSVRQATKRRAWFSSFARRAPSVSGVLIIAVGLHVGYHGWAGLSAQAAPAASVSGPRGG